MELKSISYIKNRDGPEGVIVEEEVFAAITKLGKKKALSSDGFPLFSKSVGSVMEENRIKIVMEFQEDGFIDWS